MNSVIMVVALFFSFSARATSLDYVDLPEGCWAREKFPCSLRAVRTLKNLKLKATKISIPPEAAIKMVSSSRMQLLTGYVWVREGDSFEILIEGQVARISGDVLVSKEDQKIVLQNVGGAIDFNSNRVFPSEVVPVGFENWYARPGGDGEMVRGVANLFSVEKIFKKMIPLMDGDKEQQVVALAEWRRSWAGRAEVGAQFYQEVINRRVAVVEEQKKKKADQKAQREREDQKLRQMFRAKNYIDQ